MNLFKNSGAGLNTLSQNAAHQFAMSHSMMLYRRNALYSFIPKNACSTLRLSVAMENGCIDGIEQGHWIHANNQTFNATLADAIKAEYRFVVLRCPFRRLASVFLDKFIAKEPDAWQYRNGLGRKIELDDLTFREFVLSLKKPFIFNSNIHWRPQSQFLLYQEYDDYFALENFKQAIVTLKEKIGFGVVDARELTKHGTHAYQSLADKNYADTPAFDIALMKRQGQCPSHHALYDKELFELVSELYRQDITLYRDKCQAANLMQAEECIEPELNTYSVTLVDVHPNT